MAVKNSIGHILNAYRSAHESVARYKIMLSPGAFRADVVIEPGLAYHEAKQYADRMNKEREKPSFGGPVYFIQLENPDQALAAMRERMAGFLKRPVEAEIVS